MPLLNFELGLLCVLWCDIVTELLCITLAVAILTGSLQELHDCWTFVRLGETH